MPSKCNAHSSQAEERSWEYLLRTILNSTPSSDSMGSSTESTSAGDESSDRVYTEWWPISACLLPSLERCRLKSPYNTAGITLP